MTPIEILNVAADRLQVNPPVPRDIADPLGKLFRGIAFAEQLGQLPIGARIVMNDAILAAEAVIRHGLDDQQEGNQQP